MKLETHEKLPLVISVNKEGEFMITELMFAVLNIPNCTTARVYRVREGIEYSINDGKITITITKEINNFSSFIPDMSLNIIIDIIYIDDKIFIYNIDIDGSFLGNFSEFTDTSYYRKCCRYISSDIVPILHNRNFIIYDSNTSICPISIKFKNLSKSYINEITEESKLVPSIIKKYMSYLKKIKYTNQRNRLYSKMSRDRKNLITNISNNFNLNPFVINEIKRIILDNIKINIEDINIVKNISCYNISILPKTKNEYISIGDIIYIINNEKHKLRLKFDLLPFGMYYLSVKYSISYNNQINLMELINDYLNKIY